MTISLSSDSMVFDFPVVDPARACRCRFSARCECPTTANSMVCRPGLDRSRRIRSRTCRPTACPTSGAAAVAW